MVRVKERANEIFDFARAESPYRSATKGWLTDDVFVEWGSPSKKALKQGDEVVDVSVYWSPINQILSVLFLVVFLSSIMVFLAVSFTHGRLELPFGVQQNLSSKEFVPIQQESEPVEAAPLKVNDSEEPSKNLYASYSGDARSLISNDGAAAEINTTILKSVSVESSDQFEAPISPAQPSVSSFKKDLPQAKKVTAVDLFQSRRG